MLNQINKFYFNQKVEHKSYNQIKKFKLNQKGWTKSKKLKVKKGLSGTKKV